jgi:ABC-type multidrug transport system ATPase subunit
LNKAILDAWHEKKTIFLSSHSLSDINKIINWVVVIDDGVIKYCGPKHATKDLSSFFKSYWNVTTKY